MQISAEPKIICASLFFLIKSKKSLGQYRKDLDDSYVMRDLKRFKTTAKFLADDANYTLAGTPSISGLGIAYSSSNSDKIPSPTV